jgi:PAS domain S-box-containing protein
MNHGMFDQAITCFALLDRDYRFIRVNEAFASHFRKKAEDFPGRKYSEVIPYEGGPTDLARLLEEVLRTKQPLRASALPHVFRDQPERGVTYWDSILQPILDERGEVEFVFLFLIDVTERKRVEDAAKASEERLRLTFEAAKIGTGEMDLQTNLVALSDPMQRVVGLAPGTDNLSFDEWLELIHPEDRASVREAVENSIAGNPDIVLDYRIVWPDGSVHWMTSRARTFYDETGRATRIIGAIMDITDRKRAEEESRRQRELLQKIFDNAPIGINFFDENGRLLLVNQMWERTFGWTVKELEEQNVDIYVEAVPDPRESQRAREFVAEASGEWSDFQLRKRDGTSMIVSGAVVRLSDGTRVSLSQEVTERRLAEEAAKATEERLRLTFEAARIGTGELDLQTNRVTFSKPLLRVLGLAPGTVNPTLEGYIERVHPEDRARVRQAVEETIAGQSKKTGQTDIAVDYRILWPDESVHWVTSRTKAFFDEAGRTTRIVGAIMDITERKRAEEEVRASRERYETLFEYSPVSLWELDLSEVRKYLEELRAAGVSDFAAYLAEHPEVVTRCAQLMRLLQVNKATLRILDAGSEGELLDWMAAELADESRGAFRTFRYNLAMLAAGHTSFESEVVAETRAGRRIDVLNRMTVMPGSEESWARILSLALDLTARKRAEDRLRTSLREKEVLLKEVHHRVKNNLQLISSMLSLQASLIGDRGVADSLIESQSRVRAMALVHEHLYRAADFASVQLVGYIESLWAYLYCAYSVDPERIELELQVADVTLDLDRSICCGLIVNELVSNAVKHAFPNGRKGRVSVRFESPGNGWHQLAVSDNGVGLPPGLDLAHAGTLGLQLVSELVAQLDGELTINREHGAAFVVRFRTERPEGAH